MTEKFYPESWQWALEHAVKLAKIGGIPACEIKGVATNLYDLSINGAAYAPAPKDAPKEEASIGGLCGYGGFQQTLQNGTFGTVNAGEGALR